MLRRDRIILVVGTSLQHKADMQGPIPLMLSGKRYFAGGCLLFTAENSIAMVTDYILVREC